MGHTTEIPGINKHEIERAVQKQFDSGNYESMVGPGRPFKDRWTLLAALTASAKEDAQSRVGALRNTLKKLREAKFLSMVQDDIVDDITMYEVLKAAAANPNYRKFGFIVPENTHSMQEGDKADDAEADKASNA